MLKALAALLALYAFSGCTTVLFLRDSKSRVYSDAIYESRKESFFFGAVHPEYDVYVDKICLGKDVDQIATEATAGDVLASIVTIGIYTPRTVQVWCSL